MKRIVIINGQGGVGKDTFIELLTDTKLKIINVSSVDGIKELARKVGWNGTKEERDRKFLSDLKILTSNYCGFSEYYLINKAKEFLKSDSDLMFAHIREPLRIREFLNKFPEAKTLLIKRNDISSYGNMADDGVFDFEYDYIIQNSGTIETLKTTGIEFLNTIGFNLKP